MLKQVVYRVHKKLEKVNLAYSIKTKAYDFKIR